MRDMEFQNVLFAIDAEIARLEEVRALLATGDPVIENKRPRKARMKSIAKEKAKTRTKAVTGKKRNLSAEGRARIAEAVKKRWAAQKKEAAA